MQNRQTWFVFVLLEQVPLYFNVRSEFDVGPVFKDPIYTENVWCRIYFENLNFNSEIGGKFDK